MLYQLFGQATTYGDPASKDIGLVGILLYLTIIALLLFCTAKVYMKAGRKWWEAVIPIYNMYVFLKIVGRPTWWLLLCFVPLVNLVVAIILAIDLAKSFGKDVGTGLLLVFLPFIMYPVMAFSSDYVYVGPSVGSDNGSDNSSDPAPPTNKPQPAA